MIEIKVVRSHDGLDSVLAKGLEQAAGYADTAGVDQRPNKTWEARSWQRKESY